MLLEFQSYIRVVPFWCRIQFWLELLRHWWRKLVGALSLHVPFIIFQLFIFKTLYSGSCLRTRLKYPTWYLVVLPYFSLCMLTRSRSVRCQSTLERRLRCGCWPPPPVPVGAPSAPLAPGAHTQPAGPGGTGSGSSGSVESIGDSNACDAFDCKRRTRSELIAVPTSFPLLTPF